MSTDQHPPSPAGDPGNPLHHMLVSLSGAGGPAHETGPPGASPLAVQAGHEPDRFLVRSVLYVPAAVVITLVVAYLLVTWIFSGVANSWATDAKRAREQNPQVYDQNALPTRERFGRISSERPAPLPGEPSTGVPQPRLEGLRQTHESATDPDNYRSKLPTADGNNPPELRPEDLRPENYAARPGDPVPPGQKVLAEYTWADQGKRLVRVPIDEAITLVDQKKLKLPVRKDPVMIPGTSDSRAKPSNAGRGGERHLGPVPPPTTPPGKEKENKPGGH